MRLSLVVLLEIKRGFVWKMEDLLVQQEICTLEGSLTMNLERPMVPSGSKKLFIPECSSLAHGKMGASTKVELFIIMVSSLKAQLAKALNPNFSTISEEQLLEYSQTGIILKDISGSLTFYLLGSSSLVMVLLPLAP